MVPTHWRRVCTDGQHARRCHPQCDCCEEHHFYDQARGPVADHGRSVTAMPYAFNYHFDNGVFRGLAFGNFRTPEEAARVIIGLNGVSLLGRPLKSMGDMQIQQQQQQDIFGGSSAMSFGQNQYQHSNTSSSTNNNKSSSSNISLSNLFLARVATRTAMLLSAHDQ
ncbi:hypothetical protein BX661DRAFT_172904 [Kickxella alabastrina]|uniref:uncharacterized protein n=1 Tax=Kickxella alabastrina TaxID=61397 RepID=UPI002220A9E9|nr:uncharacterized protein BX661DRAFT_172904 [Kickxella alabastrina]KAI7823158.1 hypothetical protein BX661DRAFT_172904 [Kickxella alabastrina]